MRPKNMDKRKSDGTVNYSYYCSLKEKSRSKKCNGLNVSGKKLDNKITDIIKETFVPNSEIYNELKKMAIYKNQNTQNEELKLLNSAYKKNQEETEKLVEKIKYIDIDLIDMINNSLRKLKEQKQELEAQINELKGKNINYNTNLEIATAKDILKIIDNSFNIFNSFDLKTKRDIVGLFIENIIGNGDNIEINFLNTRIDETKKKLFIPTFVQVDNFLNSNQSTDGMSKITFKE